MQAKLAELRHDAYALSETRDGECWNLKARSIGYTWPGCRLDASLWISIRFQEGPMDALRVFRR